MRCHGISHRALCWDRITPSLLTVRREAANVAISTLWCESPLAFLCVHFLNASPEYFTQWSSASICLGPPSSCCPLRLTTCLTDHYAQPNRAGFDCCYTLIFGTELYFSLSCFPKTQKTFLNKVIPQYYFSVKDTSARSSNLLIAGKIAFEPSKSIFMVCLCWWSNVTLHPFQARKSYLGNVSLFKSKRKYSCKCVGNFSYNE